MYCLLVGFIGIQGNLIQILKSYLKPPHTHMDWGAGKVENKMRIDKSLIIVTVSKEYMSRTFSKMQLMYILYLPV